MKVSFAPGGWENAGFDYACSWNLPEPPRFCQEKDCVVNRKRSDRPMDYDYASLLAPGEYTPGARLAVRCTFEERGAPMLLLSDRNEKDENGILRTLDYYEIVIWKNGLNVWRHRTENRNNTYYLALGAFFPIEQDRVHDLSVFLRRDRMLVDVDGKKMNLYVHDMPPRLRLGYSACEGRCRLIEMEIKQTPAP